MNDLNVIFFNKSFKYSGSIRPAIFMDRDGVIIKDVNYLSNLDQLEFEYGALDFLRFVNKKNLTIVITFKTISWMIECMHVWRL